MTFAEQYPDYELVPEKRSRWAWPLIWLAFFALVVAAPSVIFYKLSQLQVPTPAQAGFNSFTIPTLGQLAESESQSGNHAEAVRNFRNYFALGGHNADLMAQYAYSLAELGQREDALKWSRLAVRTSPSSKAARLINDTLEKK